MPIQDDDILLIQRGTELKQANASDLKSFTNDGYSGAITLSDNTVLIFENGLLTEVN